MLINALNFHISQPNVKYIQPKQNFASVKLNRLTCDTVSFSGIKSREYTTEKQLITNALIIHEKFKKDLQTPALQELNNTVDMVLSEYPDANYDEVISVMQKITSMASYKSITELGEKVDKDKLGMFYKTSGISASSAFHYLSEQKRQIRRSNEHDEPKILVLDEYVLKRLRYLKEKRPYIFEYFQNDISIGHIQPVLIDGFEFIADGKYHSYNIFNQSESLYDVTKSVFEERKKTGKSLDEIVSGSVLEEYKNIVGNSICQVYKINQDKPLSISNVQSNISPVIPSKETILSALRVIPEQSYRNEKNVNTASNVLAKYILANAEVFSPKRISQAMIKKYEGIEQKVKELGKTMNDVMYVIPDDKSSFTLMALQYAKANNIPPEQFINFDGYTGIPKEIKNKVLVLIDDVVGSGDSMLYEKFNYTNNIKEFNKAQVNIIFSPIVASSKGSKHIISEIVRNFRKSKDCIITNLLINKQNNQNMPKKDIGIIQGMSSYTGYGENGVCLAMPYMIPDNNSDVSGLFLSDFLIRPVSSLANKAQSYDRDGMDYISMYKRIRNMAKKVADAEIFTNLTQSSSKYQDLHNILMTRKLY